MRFILHAYLNEFLALKIIQDIVSIVYKNQIFTVYKTKII